ncbi:MAG: ABC transporter ATP-binding protein [Anaerolineae bacterium]|nr:ABC transporter ATP-binding protein [Anaerolineae bacterium]
MTISRHRNPPEAPPTPAGAPVIIDLREVKKAYHSPAGDFWALKGISAQVHTGEFLGIVGRSGAGKSTLLNMISGVDSLTSGEVLVDGISIHAMDENQAALWRGRNLGVIYQSFQLMPMLSLLQNVLLPMDMSGMWRNGRSVTRARQLLDEVGLSDHIHKLPSAISGGQQQRVAIARALANDPPILLADEPTGRLDSGTADSIMKIFEQLVAGGKTIVMVTHDQSLASRMSRVLWLADGSLVQTRTEAMA